MFIALLLIALTAVGGLPITYFVAKEKTLLWRLSVGVVVGSAILGLFSFLLPSLGGFSVPVLIAAFAITLAPLAIFRDVNYRRDLEKDWARAKGGFQGANIDKAKRFAYYAGFFLLFWLFFDKTMFMVGGAINTGGSQNLGDLPYHLGTIFSFTEANNFPVVNPSWVGAKYTYPFVADLLSSVFVKLGADVISAMFVQNVAWAFALFVIFEDFVATITGSKLAGRVASPLLFLSGGLGFIGAYTDFSAGSKGLYDFLMNLPRDYTITDKYRWGNSLVVLFMTQRSLLLGMPLTLFVLGFLWRIFVTRGDAEEAEKPEKVTFSLSQVSWPLVVIGMLAGCLVLIHLHSLLVLFVVTAFLFVMQPRQWLRWITFGIGVAIVAVPELVWAMTGTATESTKFFEVFFGWDKREANFAWFWFINTGLLFPALAVGIWVYLTGGKLIKKEGEQTGSGPRELLLFYIPFAFLFILSNSAKLAPWEWDNIKILIYWFAGTLPFVALAIAWAWEHSKHLKIAAAVSVFILVAAGSLDVWRSVSGQIKYGVFEPDAVKIAELIRQKTDPKAIFLNGPTFNSPVVLSGRQSVMRYSGHLASHGIDYYPRETEVKAIYSGSATADTLLAKYNVDYVIMTPEERNQLKANEEFFKKFPVVAEAGQYKVYKVK